MKDCEAVDVPSCLALSEERVELDGTCMVGWLVCAVLIAVVGVGSPPTGKLLDLRVARGKGRGD